MEGYIHLIVGHVSVAIGLLIVISSAVKGWRILKVSQIIDTTKKNDRILVVALIAFFAIYGFEIAQKGLELIG